MRATRTSSMQNNVQPIEDRERQRNEFEQRLSSRLRWDCPHTLDPVEGRLRSRAVIGANTSVDTGRRGASGESLGYRRSSLSEISRTWDRDHR
jgi:hypothetical protein